jgi:membrane associated rhomboid family serine protease
MITPVVTWALIALNVAIYFLVQPAIPNVPDLAQVPEAIRGFYDRFAVIPAVVAGGGNPLSVLTAMFLHGGVLHLAGNMLYLWIFGDNVEHAFGHWAYLAFYLLAGIAATVVQVVLFPSSTIWNLGASGAIAGVLGAYVLLYPRSLVNVLVGRSIVRVPSLLAIGAWFALQFFSGASQLATAATADVGGVAFWAHIGGFLAGLGMALLAGGRARARAMGEPIAVGRR